MKAKTKHYVSFVCGNKIKAFFNVFPQQEWTVIAKGNGVSLLERKGARIEIPLDYYEKHFIEISEGCEKND